LLGGDHMAEIGLVPFARIAREVADAEFDSERNHT
jgi:hypothetical protein